LYLFPKFSFQFSSCLLIFKKWENFFHVVK
jgi:hypothetical protein